MPLKHFNRGRKKWSIPKIIAAAVGGTILVVVFAALFGLLVQYLWNWIMPGIFNLREITYAEAFGILILARILVGGFGGKGGGNSGKWGKDKWSEENCGEDWEDWKHYEEWWEKEGKDSLKKFSEAKNKKVKKAK